MTDSKIPQGVVAILVGNDGREIANSADFNSGSPGGFTQQEAQRMRAVDRLSVRAIEILSSPTMSKAIDSYMAKQIVDKMCHNNGCKVVIVPFGYEG